MGFSQWIDDKLNAHNSGSDPKKKTPPPTVVDTVALKKRMDRDAGLGHAGDLVEREDTLRTIRGQPFPDSDVKPGSVVAKKPKTK